MVGFGLPVHVLKIDQFWDSGMDINMMTAVDTGKPNASALATASTKQIFLEPDSSFVSNLRLLLSAIGLFL